MVNLKGKILKALEKAVAEDGIKADISDSYPDDFSKDTQIQYTEEQNKAHEMSGNTCMTSYVRYRLDIWNKRSTSELAVLVDKAMNGELGLTRSDCTDDNSNHIKHKIMRYEGIVDERTEKIYSPR